MRLVMYHKVSCSVHIFPVPLSQVDDGIIKELSNSHHVQVYPDPHVSLTERRKKKYLARYADTINMLVISSKIIHIFHQYPLIHWLRYDKWIFFNNSSHVIWRYSIHRRSSCYYCSVRKKIEKVGIRVGQATGMVICKEMMISVSAGKSNTCLKSEIEKSRYVENELKTIKDTVTNLDKVFSEDRLRKSVPWCL